MSLALTSATRLDRRSDRPPVTVVVAGLLVAAIVVVAAVAPAIAPYDPLDQDLLALNQAPSAAHWLGTDHIGRDVLSRLLVGTRTTLLIGVGGAAIASLIGGGIGLVALALGRVADTLVFGAVDLVRALPPILLALLLVVALGAGVGSVAIALGLSFAPFFAYVARAAYRREMAQDYVVAARTFGGGPLHVLGLHVLPNLAGALITQAAIVLPRCIVTESVLSFLGLGSSPDAPTWGRMVADSSRYIEIAPHAILAPVIAIVVLTASLSLIGDDLRHRLDPLRHARGAAGPEPQP
ncbi:MAG: ABC transporter permease [Rhodoplanes sp.]|uniref:ABC transporter permease n=1 Tax=Rhodoplanes sp. TaxID=1968906 RepID=UPI0018204F57|nr:ABC transporter permease [Rhodoplanes sp.]NVO13092.1 ABC transporter permease [Rhodoplanes sp.]